jgi:hypothetical protein
MHVVFEASMCRSLTWAGLGRFLRQEQSFLVPDIEGNDIRAFSGKVMDRAAPDTTGYQDPLTAIEKDISHCSI